MGLASPCQHQDLWTPSKGKLTPFRSRCRDPQPVRVLGIFRDDDYTSVAEPLSFREPVFRARAVQLCRTAGADQLLLTRLGTIGLDHHLQNCLKFTGRDLAMSIFIEIDFMRDHQSHGR